MKRRDLHFGVVLPTGFLNDLPGGDATRQYEVIREIAKEAESLGFSSAWLYDHFVSFSRSSSEPCFESWTTLTALAASTTTIRLGTLVSCAVYRHPGLLAKVAATVDRLSGGRLEFGIGAGWYEADFQRYGIPFEKSAERIARLEEAVRALKKLWTEEVATFQGKYYPLRACHCEPKPLQKPHPPILIGGGGPHLTLRVVARLADRSNFALWLDEDAVRAKNQILDGYCQQYQRDPRTIERSLNREVILAKDGGEALRRAESLKPGSVRMESFLRPRIVGDQVECARKLKGYIDVGITSFMLYVYDAAGLEPLRLLARESLPLLKNESS